MLLRITVSSPFVKTKVPILGDIPLIGWLFRNRATTVRKTNLLIFVKPTIISDYSDMRKMYHQKAEQRRKFVTKAYGEEDVNQKYIDEKDALKIDKPESEEKRDTLEIYKPEGEEEDL